MPKDIKSDGPLPAMYGKAPYRAVLRLLYLGNTAQALCDIAFIFPH